MQPRRDYFPLSAPATQVNHAVNVPFRKTKRARRYAAEVRTSEMAM